jgi:elongation factor G
MDFPEPVISVAVEPKTKDDQEKMGIALGKLAQEDPSFRVKTDEETGQTIISGMESFTWTSWLTGCAVSSTSKPTSVSLRFPRERITKNCEIEGKFVRQSGGRGQFGHCWIRFAPADEGQEGLQFVNEVVGGVVPKEYIPAIQKGIKEGSGLK